MIKMIGITLIVSLLLSSQAWAGENEDLRPLSPRTATAFSVYGTLVPTALCITGLSVAASDSYGDPGKAGAVALVAGFVGLWFGPGLGYLYAHHPWGFWRGALIRVGGAGAMVGAFAITWDDPDASGGWELFLGGAAIIAGSAIYDIAMAGKSARQYNREIAYRKVDISPVYFQEEKTLGLGLSIKF